MTHHAPPGIAAGLDQNGPVRPVAAIGLVVGAQGESCTGISEGLPTLDDVRIFCVRT